MKTGHVALGPSFVEQQVPIATTYHRPLENAISISITPEHSDYDIAKCINSTARVLNSIYGDVPSPHAGATDEPIFGSMRMPDFCSMMPDIYDVEENMREARMGASPTRMSMLAMRMKWGPFSEPMAAGLLTALPFRHVAVHAGDKRVFVFLVTHTQEAITIEDDVELYPSDALVTKLRLLADTSK